MSQLLEDETLNLYAGEYQLATANRPFLLEGGKKLTNGVLAYETYGALNSERQCNSCIPRIEWKSACGWLP
jgi:homoserine acetyltransferase